MLRPLLVSVVFCLLNLASGPGAPGVPLAAPFPDAEAQHILRRLLIAPSAEAEPLVQRIVASGDERFTAVLIDLLWARRVGIGPGLPEEFVGGALKRLTGQRFGDDWHGWVEWYGATSLQPPPEYARWKGTLMASIDPALGEFIFSAGAARLRLEEVLWGGVHVDGIPALDHPKTLPAGKADFLEADEPVFGMVINGASRAYPLRILDWHEMANDALGGVSFSLSYCTLCGAAIAYLGKASDGRAYTFGSSGFLYRSNKLMYDRQTRSLWNQMTGEPVLGPLAASPPKLDMLPVVLTSWGTWRTEHPETTVLSLETGHERPYVRGLPYGNYFAAPTTMFPVWQRGRLLPAKSRIFALRLGGQPKAYPVDRLTQERVVNDTLAGQDIVLIAASGEVTTSTTGHSGGKVEYASGAAVRAYRRTGQRFSPHEQPPTVKDALGSTWKVTEEALVGPDGTRLERLPGHLAYWFGWYAFFPKTLVYGQP